MALLILVTVLIGFAHTYFLAGMVRARLPNKLVHVHGAIFVSWILLLQVQVGLVATRHVKWHRRLGILGVVLAPLMVVFGVWTLIDSVQRHGVTDLSPEMLLAGDLMQLLFFSIFVTWGLLARGDGAAHKRLMIFATLAILMPALSRWPYRFLAGLIPFLAFYLCYPALIVVFDLVSRKRLHRVTAWGSLLMALMIVIMLALPHATFWHHFTAWIQKL